MLRPSPAATPSNLSAQPDTVTGVAKTRPQYRCSECHHVTAKWVGRCSDCGTWGTVDEVAVLTALGGSAQRSLPRNRACTPLQLRQHRRPLASGVAQTCWLTLFVTEAKINKQRLRVSAPRDQPVLGVYGVVIRKIGAVRNLHGKNI